MPIKSFIKVKKGNVWKDLCDDKLYLQRCPRCEAENYCLMVSTGVCCWCGYRAKVDDITDLNNNNRMEGK
jgi:hypothetical protein